MLASLIIPKQVGAAETDQVDKEDHVLTCPCNKGHMKRGSI